MSGANPLWGAPRVHGELLKLGIDVGQNSVAKYMVRRRVPPSQGWRTFLRNHADGIAAMDLFVVPTISFRLLYGLPIMGVCTENLKPDHSGDEVVCRGKAQFLRGCESLPARVAPAGSNRSRR
jgi:hypothetical protein